MSTVQYVYWTTYVNKPLQPKHFEDWHKPEVYHPAHKYAPQQDDALEKNILNSIRKNKVL